MNVDTGTFEAITAERDLLSAQLRRGRHRAARKPWRPVDGFWWSGRADAYQSVIQTAGAMLSSTDDDYRETLRAVLTLATAGMELQEDDYPPGDWH